LKKFILTLSTAFILSSSALFNTAIAGSNIENKGLTKSQQLIKSSGSRATQNIRNEEIQKVVKEAVEVVNRTNKVLFLLAHNKVQEAKKELKTLKEKMDKLDKKYKGKLKRLPVEVVVTEIRGIEDLKVASKLAKQAKKAVNDNDFVTGRFLLDILRNEIRIDTAYLPIALYKEAIDLAYKFLEKGNIRSAMEQLGVAIGTIEVETTIIPRPLAIASLLVEDASKIYSKNPKTALELLDEAKKQVKLARVLGYIKTEKEIEPLIKQIDELKTAIVKKLKSSNEKFGKLIKSLNKTKKQETKTNK